MPNEPLDPRLGAKYLNELIAYGDEVQRDTVRLIIRNFMQDGYMPLTQPLTGAEREAWLLTDAAEQEAMQLLQSPDVAARAQGVELAVEIQEARSGKQTAA